ncbi:MAG: putative inorganic carbon transporter subunit DabA, partial [Pseudonocardiaceae bacterium]
LYGGTVLAGWAQRADSSLGRTRRRGHRDLTIEYINAKRQHEAARQARILRGLARSVGPHAEAELRDLSEQDLERLIEVLRSWESQEGYTWLRSMEAHYIDELVRKVRLPGELEAERRPFAQAFLCLDVRSEPLRRQLEALGDYKTFGTAGFFGVPIGFLEYGNGSEQPLCPAIMSPKSLIVEIPAHLDLDEEPLYGALSHVFHQLKESVLAPFLAVEAAGLLFSLGLIGKSLWPVRFYRTYERLHGKKPLTRLLIDKLTPEQADSILRAVQRAMIGRAIQKELGLGRHRITDDDVRELREIALGHSPQSPALTSRLGLAPEAWAEFIAKLRTVYRVDRHEATLQMERLGRLGFSLEEQAQYVYRTLLSCGLNRNFSRFVLMVGHESLTRNNPYESALDC